MKASHYLLDTIHDFMKMKSVSNYPRKYPNEFNQIIELTNFLPTNASIRQRFIHIINNLTTIPLCKHCGEKHSKWKSNNDSTINFGYNSTCGLSCGTLYELTKEKANTTNLKRYGTKNPNALQEVKDKTKATNQKKFGVDYAQQSQEVKDKIAITNIERYGNVCSLHDNGEIEDKTKATNQKKFGVDYAQQSQEVKDKIAITNIERYGGTAPACDPIIREKMRGSLYAQSGYMYYAQKDIPFELLDKLANRDYLIHLHHDQKQTITEIAASHDISYTTIRRALVKHDINVMNYGGSFPQQELAQYITSLYDGMITHNTKSVLITHEIDIYLPDINLAFEYNGNYHHSEARGKNKQYHLAKTIGCADVGVRLIHIHSHEWDLSRDIVCSRISNMFGHSLRIGARKTHIVELTNDQTNSFMKETHIQGACKSSVKLGLLYNGELVACMTFGKSRFDKKVEWELIRYSNALYTSVVGGASKLFMHFIKKYNPSSVISYSDKRWNTGNLYTRLGFDLDHISAPNYKYFHKVSDSVLYSRNQFQKHKLKDKLVVFDPDLTEWQNMQVNGYNRIWDCGNDVFIYTK